MSKINVEEILKKYSVITSTGDSSGGVWKSDVLAAIKEIIELVVDKHEKEAKHYMDDNGAFEYDQNNISLKVKEEVNYE